MITLLQYLSKKQYVWYTYIRLDSARLDYSRDNLQPVSGVPDKTFSLGYFEYNTIARVLMIFMQIDAEHCKKEIFPKRRNQMQPKTLMFYILERG